MNITIGGDMFAVVEHEYRLLKSHPNMLLFAFITDKGTRYQFLTEAKNQHIIDDNNFMYFDDPILINTSNPYRVDALNHTLIGAFGCQSDEIL